MLYNTSAGITAVVKFLAAHWVAVGISLYLFADNFDETEIAALILISLLDILIVTTMDIRAKRE